MGNPETKTTLGYDIEQRQANAKKTNKQTNKHGKLKDEHGPYRKKKVLTNVGNYGWFTSIFLDNVCLIFVFRHSIKYEINQIKY